jgi:RNA polymerase sigma factor (sigma-70 family)
MLCCFTIGAKQKNFSGYFQSTKKQASINPCLTRADVRTCAVVTENFSFARHCLLGMTDTPEEVLGMNRLVRILAGRVLAGLPRDSGIEMSDLIQAGNLGLLQATRTFSPQSGAPLAGYAKFRIRGEMLDAVRRNWDPGRIALATQGATAEDRTDMESMIPAPPELSPHSLLAKTQRAAILGEEVARLPLRYRVVVRLRYSREFSLREIGTVLRVRESRACQLHRNALGRLRRALWKRGLRGMSTLM